MYETFYSFRNYKNNKDLVKRDGEIGGQQMCLEKLENCEVKLLDVSDSLLVDWVNNSKVFIGPTQESIFIRSCENTTFTIATKQLRTRDCKNCTFYLFCKTEPIVERTTGCTFRAFNGKYKGTFPNSTLTSLALSIIYPDEPVPNMTMVNYPRNEAPFPTSQATARCQHVVENL